MNTDNSFALRSLWDSSRRQFADQFFVDACRDVPPWGEGRSSSSAGGPCRERATRERRRCSSSSSTRPRRSCAREVREKAGEEHGAFTAAVLAGLTGAGSAKAWSWSQQSYEVRWERLASYVKNRVEREKRKVADAAAGELLQIPQDTGSRGVARDRDVVIASFPRDAFPKERLEVKLDPATAYPTADVRVLDALRDVAAGQVGFAGGSVVFYLAAGHVRAAGGRAEARGPGG